jgi:phospholipid/cholesterol/gamma-HCH transport system ATP-binding protein
MAASPMPNPDFSSTSGLPSPVTISVHDVVTHYGTREVLHKINLDICRGETMVILGGSGSGKSTLIRHIVGLERVTSGEIHVLGKNICGLKEKEFNEIRKKIGMSFQGSALFNSLSIAENVALPLREHTELEDSTIRIMTRIKLESVGLAGFEDYFPSQLSGGMKKRAGIARALAMDPEILLFDEPSAGLDPVIAAGIDDLILKLKQAFQMTIVVVTHELASAFLIADRITVLDKGYLIATGTREEVRASTHPRVRQFLDRVPDQEAEGAEQYLDSLLN